MKLKKQFYLSTLILASLIIPKFSYSNDHTIIQAIDKQDIKEVTRFMKEMNAATREWINREHYVLYRAVFIGNIEIIKTLLDYGVDINSIPRGAHASVLANNTSVNKEKILNLLVDHGIDLNLKHTTGRTPLMLTKNYELAKLLIKKGADINLKDDYSSTALHKQSYNVNYKIVELLINSGAKINEGDSRGRTPIMVAINRYNPPSAYNKENIKKTIDILIKNGGTLGDNDEANKKLLVKSAESGQLHGGILKVFLDKGIDLNSYHSKFSKRSPLLKTKSVEVARALIEAGADINYKDKFGRTALDYAAMHNNLEMVKFLSNAGSSTYHKSKEQNLAIKILNSEDPYGYKINEEVDINSKDGHGWTPLMYAIFGDKKILEEEAGISKSYDPMPKKHFYKKTTKNIDIMKTLGTDLNIKDSMGRTALTWSILSKKRDMTEHLIKLGANPNLKDNGGITPLIYAISEYFYIATKLLVEAGADVNLADKNGNTPLMLAASKNATKESELLINNGADINLKNNEGQTALDIATSKKYNSIIKIISKGHPTNSDRINNQQ